VHPATPGIFELRRDPSSPEDTQRGRSPVLSLWNEETHDTHFDDVTHRCDEGLTVRVLYIGGSGEISFECVHESVRVGHDVTVFNRGHHNAGLPTECRFITGDFEDDAAYAQLAADQFDVICQFRLFTPPAIQRDIDLFSGRCGQYVFISSASAYAKPVRNLPITESTALQNPHWAYSRAKAQMESMLESQNRLPFTIVRPSHTYRTKMPTALGGEVSRLLRGKPVVIHGDGESLWTVTHAQDFAPPFVRLLGQPAAIREAFHITGDRNWPWNEIFEAIAGALGITDAHWVHVPSETLIRYHHDWEGPLLGDKSASVQFDNRKVKSVVGNFDCPIDPWEGMRMVAERFPPRADAFDPTMDALHDRIASEQEQLGR
jgi:nucleoside-diphosphate-sugar epimerase